VEGLGNHRDGLGRVQERLSSFHGTQCGFCTPGMIMAMNSLLEGGDSEETAAGPTSAEIEKALDGNICRCTGYRPILDAFKSFASDDVSEADWDKVCDIEDITNTWNGRFNVTSS
jgi:xanthine dehydrogenase/oxidase